jgi:uncharacterized protein
MGGSLVKIDVSLILKEPGASLPFDAKGMISGLTVDGGVAEVREPLTVRGVTTSLGNGVYVEANVRGSVELQCSRCLSTFERPIDLSCEGKFTGDVLDKEPEDEDEVEVFPLEGTYCDLDEMIRHEIVLSLPMKPLCREDCKGLCPTCGKNLNEGVCDCASPEEPSSRFGRKLLEAVDERGKKDGRS